MSVRHFLSLTDCSPTELQLIIQRAIELKRQRQTGQAQETLKGRVLGMIFEKSTRTRLSFEAGMFHLGGHSIFLSPRDTQLGRGEPLADSSIVMSSMLDAVMLTEFAKHATVPVINGLSDDLHPCQLLADLQTFTELRGAIQGKTAVWIGDGNNMCNSLQFDFNLRIACPKGYEPDPQLVAWAGQRVSVTDDPQQAVQGAHLISTDVWASMGQEDQAQARMAEFRPFQVSKELLDLAADDVLLMHCLPAHRGEEVSLDVLDDPRAVVWQQAENRLHAQKALLEFLINPALYQHG